MLMCRMPIVEFAVERGDVGLVGKIRGLTPVKYCRVCRNVVARNTAAEVWVRAGKDGGCVRI
jgi:hypothetical protein